MFLSLLWAENLAIAFRDNTTIKGIIVYDTDIKICQIKNNKIPRRQDDHGTIVFHCQPCLTMVDSVVAMVSDHGL